MEYRNSQVEPPKMAQDLLVKTVRNTVGSILLFTMLCSCSTMQDRYLFPTNPSYIPATEEGEIILQEFSEDFFADGDVGVSRVGRKQQTIKAMKSEVSSALHSLVAIRLADKKDVSYPTDKGLWDLTVDGLDRQSGAAILLGGEIRQFSVQASTTAVRLKTEYEFLIELDCYIGKVIEKKVVKRSVRYGQKMLNFSPSHKAMDKLLDKFLEEAALQVVENIESFL